jgi:hypothetical protein
MFLVNRSKDLLKGTESNPFDCAVRVITGGYRDIRHQYCASYTSSVRYAICKLTLEFHIRASVFSEMLFRVKRCGWRHMIGDSDFFTEPFRLVFGHLQPKFISWTLNAFVDILNQSCRFQLINPFFD